MKKNTKKQDEEYYKSPSFLMRFTIAFFMFFVGFVMYSEMPDSIPIHWNFAGQADSWGDKIWAIWLLPAITLAMVFLFPILAKIDPKHKNYKDFQGVWELIQTVIIVFFTYIYVIQFYMILYPEQGDIMGKLMMSGIAALFIILGAVMGKIEQNYFVGLKTPWALDDPKVWKKSQRFAGWAFMIGGFIFLINAWLQICVQTVFILTVIGMVLIPVVYSYRVSKKK